MTTLKGIKGFRVKTVSTDPASSGIAAGSWASGGAINTGRSYGAGAGSTTAGIIFGGSEPSKSAKTESYNGSSWTEVNDMNTARAQMAPAIRAPYTAALIAGGEEPSISNKVESWNGSSWTETTEINTARRIAGGAGIQTSMLIFGGYVGPPAGPPGTTANTESWNGSAWTEVNNLNSGRYTLCGAGATNTAALAFGGSSPPYASITEQWDGTNWTEVADLNTGRDEGMSAGIYTAALAIGGLASGSPYITKTENWDGSSWTEIADLATGRAQGLSSAGTNTAAFVAGGNPGNLNSMEVFTASTTFSKLNLGQVYFNSTTNTFKVTQQSVANGTWSSGASLNTAGERFGGAVQGTPSAGLVFGRSSSPYGQTEEYNGTAWSEQNDLNTGRYISGGGSGTQTACVYAGGYNPAGSPQYETNNSETYNGTSWTEGNNLNEGRIDCTSFGTSTAGILVGGAQAAGGPGTVASVEIYDGTSWTETTDIPTVTQEMGGLGLQTAGLIFGGSVDSDPSTKNTTVEWDGTSWYSGGTYPINVKYTTGFGSQTSGIGASGEKIPGGATGICNHYNGTSWTEIAELSTARTSLVANGSASTGGMSGFVTGGYTPPGPSTITEEWNVPTSNATITLG